MKVGLPSASFGTEACASPIAVAEALADLRADFVGDADADEIFARAGRRDRAAAVVGIGAGADDRRIADPAPALAGEAAGRGRGGDMALLVERDRADRAVFEVRRRNARRSGRARSSSSWRRRSAVWKYSGGACSSPCSRENWSAPSRLRKTCGLCSITRAGEADRVAASR